MKLYIYEHCPFCVMTKMIFVLKNHPVEIAYLLYDDVHMPMQMIGRKQVPILEYQSSRFMPESKDIIEYVDHKVGEPKITVASSQELVRWADQVQRFIYRLTYPRWIKAPFPEFSTEEARNYFYQSKDPSGGGFISDLSDPRLIRRAQKALEALEKLLKDYPLLDSHRQLSWSDFSIFALLHSLSIVKGLIYGPRVEHWRQQASKVCSIPLHDEYAI